MPEAGWEGARWWDHGNEASTGICPAAGMACHPQHILRIWKGFPARLQLPWFIVTRCRSYTNVDNCGCILFWKEGINVSRKMSAGIGKLPHKVSLIFSSKRSVELNSLHYFLQRKGGIPSCLLGAAAAPAPRGCWGSAGRCWQNQASCSHLHEMVNGLPVLGASLFC